MTADLQTKEFLTFTDENEALALSPRRARSTIFHEYGRVAIADGGQDFSPAEAGSPEPTPVFSDSLSLTEELGMVAFALRQSSDFGKNERAYDGQSWNGSDGGAASLHPSEEGADEGHDAEPDKSQDALAPASALSSRMTGRIAVATVIVSGPTPALKFSDSEIKKVIAECQNGLSYLADQAPDRDVTFVHDIQHATVDAADVTSGGISIQERDWRDEALGQLGVGSGVSGAAKWARKVRSAKGANWGYVAFFTKYTLGHFAYASIGGPRLVMNYQNDGWGPSNIDRVFAHETGHIFGAPDEYGNSNCDCGGSYGYFNHPNSNCALCAPGGGVSCIMRSNEWSMCRHTKLHFGYNGVAGSPSPGDLVG